MSTPAVTTARSSLDVTRLRVFYLPVAVFAGIAVSVGVFQTLSGSYADSQVLNRSFLTTELLRHLVTVAEDAAAEEPALAEKFRLPPSNGSNEAFRTLADAIGHRGEA